MAATWLFDIEHYFSSNPQLAIWPEEITPGETHSLSKLLKQVRLVETCLFLDNLGNPDTLEEWRKTWKQHLPRGLVAKKGHVHWYLHPREQGWFVYRIDIADPRFIRAGKLTREEFFQHSSTRVRSPLIAELIKALEPLLGAPPPSRHETKKRKKKRDSFWKRLPPSAPLPSARTGWQAGTSDQNKPPASPPPLPGEPFEDWPYQETILVAVGGELHLFKGCLVRSSRLEILFGEDGHRRFMKMLEAGDRPPLYLPTDLEARSLRHDLRDHAIRIDSLIAALQGELYSLPRLGGHKPKDLIDYLRTVLPDLTRALRECRPGYKYLLRGRFGIRVGAEEAKDFQVLVEQLEPYLHCDEVLQLGSVADARHGPSLLALLSWLLHKDETDTTNRIPWLELAADTVPLLQRCLKYPFSRPEDVDVYLELFFKVKARLGQRAGIYQLFERRGTHLAVMPTGSGKSLIYWGAAKIQWEEYRGSTVVISPLQALIRDQIQEAERYFEKTVTYIDSAVDARDRYDTLWRYARGEIALLYMTPEQFVRREVQEALQRYLPDLWVFDEVHTLLEWGTTFRPAYQKGLQGLRHLIPRDGRILLTTATLTFEERDRLHELFADFGEFHIAAHELEFPPNLEVEIALYEDENKQINRIAQELDAVLADGHQAIVFCITPDQTERLQESLSALLTHPTAAYHGELFFATRTTRQKEFAAGTIKVMFATSAFSLGINHPGVRLVIHAYPPASIEAFVQQIGRATRTDEPAKTLVACNPADLETQFYLTSTQLLRRDDYRAIFTFLRRLGQAQDAAAALWLTPADLTRLANLDDATGNAEIRAELALHRLERLEVITLEPQTAGHLEIRELDLSEKRDDLGFAAGLVAEYLALPSAQVETLTDIMKETGLQAHEVLAGLAELQRANHLRYRFPVRVTFNKGTRFGALRGSLERFFEVENRVREALDRPEVRGTRLPLPLDELQGRILEHDEDGEFLEVAEIRSVLEFWRHLGWIRWSLGANRELELIFLEYDAKTWFSRVREQLPELREAFTALIDILYEQVPTNGAHVSANLDLGRLEAELPNDLTAAQLLGILHRLHFAILSGGANLEGTSYPILYNVDHQVTLQNLGYVKLREENQGKYCRLHLLAELLKLRDGSEVKEFLGAYFTTPLAELFQAHFRGRMPHALPCRLDDYRRIMDLSQAQRAIVEATDRALLVVAGPGSGKTRSIVARVAHLVRIERVPASKILVVAFNRQAVLEVRRRLRELLGVTAHRVTVKTFHGLALEILDVGLQDLMREDEQDPQKALDKLIPKALQKLKDDKRESGEEEARLRGFIGKYNYVLVDEYQDITEDKYELVKILVGHGEGEDRESTRYNLWAVGDDDQSLYEFLEADPRFIHSFEADYDTARKALIENFRSTPEIVALSNHLISHAETRTKTRPEEQVVSKRESGEPVRHYIYQTKHDALRFVITEIMALLEEGFAPGDIAVLASRWRTVVPLWGVLREIGIPTQLVRSKSPVPPFKSAAVQDLLGRLDGLRGRQSDFLLSNAIRVSMRLPNWPPFAPSLGRALRAATEFDEERIASGLHQQVVNLRAVVQQYKAELMEYQEVRGFSDEVTLSTIHSAKGLEFRAVFVIGELPHRDAKPEAELRKHYVGVTRAEDLLYLVTPQRALSSLPIAGYGALQPVGLRSGISLPDRADLIVDLDEYGDVYLSHRGTLKPHTQDLLRVAHATGEPRPLQVKEQEKRRGAHRYSYFRFYCPELDEEIGASSRRGCGRVKDLLRVGTSRSMKGELLEGTYFQPNGDGAERHLVPVIRLNFRMAYNFGR